MQILITLILNGGLFYPETSQSTKKTIIWVSSGGHNDTVVTADPVNWKMVTQMQWVYVQAHTHHKHTLKANTQIKKKVT